VSQECRSKGVPRHTHQKKNHEKIQEAAHLNPPDAPT
jgi:hypothetical protein